MGGSENQAVESGLGVSFVSENREQKVDLVHNFLRIDLSFPTWASLRPA